MKLAILWGIKLYFIFPRGYKKMQPAPNLYCIVIGKVLESNRDYCH